MSVKVIVQVDGAADWVTHNANARFRLDRDTTVAFAAPTEVVTTALVSGTDRYEVWDASGSSTSWYRFRIEDAADGALSGWSTPWQVLEERPIATLAGVKLRLGSGATSTDDDVLQTYIDAINGYIIRRLGYYPGPSSATTRTYDGNDAVRDGRRLWIAEGIRSLTSLTIAASTGAVGTAATLTDVAFGPHVSTLQPGEPYAWLEFKDVCTGAWSSFPAGYGNVVVVGAFGWISPPPDLVRIADAWVVRAWKARLSGDADVVGSDEFGNEVISDRMPAEWRRIIEGYRVTGWVG